MSTGAPWSVKGIDAEARTVAKDLARRAGLTLGEWLNQMILEGRDVGAEIAQARQASAPPSNARQGYGASRQPSEPRPYESRRVRGGGVESSLQPQASRYAGNGTRSEPRQQNYRQDRERPAYDADYHDEAYDDRYGSPKPAPYRHDYDEDSAMRQGPHHDDAVDARYTARYAPNGGGQADAVRGVSRAVEALLDRLERSEARAADNERRLSGSQSDILDRTEKLTRRTEAETATLYDSLSVTKERLTAHEMRLTMVEQDIQDAVNSDAIKSVEGALGRMANQLYEDGQKTRATITDVRTDMVSLSHRIAQLEVRDPQKDAESAVDQAVARMAQRLEGTEARTQAAIKVLEQAFASLDSRLLRAEERGDVTDPDAVQSLSRLANDLSRRVDDARLEMHRLVEEASARQVSEARLGGLEQRLDGMSERLDSMDHQTHAAIEQLSQDVGFYGDRLQNLNSEMANASSESSSHTQALERLGSEIARTSERLAQKLAEQERRTAQVLAGVSEQIEARHAQLNSEIGNRIAKSEARTQKLLQETQIRLDEGLAEAQKQAIIYQSQSQRLDPEKAHHTAASQQSDTHDDVLRDLPNPFARHKSLAESLKPATIRQAKLARPLGFDKAPEPINAEDVSGLTDESISIQAKDEAFVSKLQSRLLRVPLSADVFETEPRAEENDTVPTIDTFKSPAQVILDLPPVEVHNEDPEILHSFIPDQAEPLSPQPRHAASQTDRQTESETPDSEPSVSHAAQTPALLQSIDDFDADPFRDIDESRRAAPPQRDFLTPKPEFESARQAKTFSDEMFENASAPQTTDFVLASASEGADDDLGLFESSPTRASTQAALQKARAAVIASQQEELRIEAESRLSQQNKKGNTGSKPNPSNAPLLSNVVKASTVAVLATVIGLGGVMTFNEIKTTPHANKGAEHKLVVETVPTDRVATVTEIKADAQSQSATPQATTESMQQAFVAAQRALKASDPSGLVLLKTVANQGLDEAQFLLAQIYDGRVAGYKADKTQARQWYQRAASQGLDKARYNLALMYYNGEGGSVDKSQAATLFRQAAENGFSDAQFNLATLYENGDGVPVDFTEAYRWNMAAARSGDKEASGRVQTLKPRLNARQRELAEAEVNTTKQQAKVKTTSTQDMN